MQGKIYPPSEDLKDFVLHYWTLDFPRAATPDRNTIVPDGTIKLIFHYGDLYWHHPPDRSSFLQPRCFCIGQLTKPYVVEPAGDTGTFVIRFHPHGFLPFARLPLAEMVNQPVAIDELYGAAGADLADSILKANTTSQRIALAEAFLRAQLLEQTHFDTVIANTVDTLLSLNGQLSVAELSEQQEIHRRQLTRKFKTAIGLSPKQLAKVVRLQAVLTTLQPDKNYRLTDVAYDAAYYDQSHFIKDFREFTGLSPKEYYGEDLKMSMIFDRK